MRRTLTAGVAVAITLLAGCGTSAPSSHRHGKDNAYSRAQRICNKWAKDSPRIREAYVSVGAKPECVGLSRSYEEVHVPLRWVEATENR